MEKKDTSKIVEELKLTPAFSDFYDENKIYMVDTTLSEMINGLMEQKGLKKKDVVKASEISETYAYQILSGMRVPDRKKLLCLAFGMKLSLDETQKLLKCAGYAPLYVKLPFDCVVIYGLTKGLSVVGTNELLYEYGEETLG